MKKHNTFKVLGILLLLVLVASYFLVGRSGALAYIGITDIFMKYLQTLYYFFYLIVFLLAVGGLYGVLSKSSSYKKLLDNIVTKTKLFGKKIIFVFIVILSIIASFTGITLPLIIFVPFVSAIILMLGYDKLVALATTIGSIVVGYLGGVFVTFSNPNTGVLTTYETFVGLEGQFANMFPKLLLLFAGIALLIAFVNSYIVAVENKKVKFELSDDSQVLASEVSGDYKKIKVWPMIVTLISLFVILVLGTFPFESLFGATFFATFHTIINSLTIGGLLLRLIVLLVAFGLVVLVQWVISLIKKKKFKFKFLLPVWISIITVLVLEIINAAGWFNLYDFSFIGKFAKTLAGNAFLDFAVVQNSIFSELVELGGWASNGDSMCYLLISIVLIIYTGIIALIDKIKFDDLIDNTVNGFKKMIPTVLLVLVAYTVLVASYTNGFMEAIISGCSKFNYGLSSLLGLLGSILSVDNYYIVAGVFSPILNLITDESIYESVAIMFQGIFSIFTILAPTSVLLLFGLSYFDVPYTTWIKFIWRFILGLIILLAFVVMLVVLL